MTLTDEEIKEIINAMPTKVHRWLWPEKAPFTKFEMEQREMTRQLLTLAYAQGYGKGVTHQAMLNK